MLLYSFHWDSIFFYGEPSSKSWIRSNALSIALCLLSQPVKDAAPYTIRAAWQGEKSGRVWRLVWSNTKTWSHQINASAQFSSLRTLSNGKARQHCLGTPILEHLLLYYVDPCKNDLNTGCGWVSTQQLLFRSGCVRCRCRCRRERDAMRFVGRP